MAPIFKAISVAVLVGIAVAACAPQYRDGWGSHMGGAPMIGGWLMMSLYGLLGTFLAVLAALFVFRWLTGGAPGANAPLDLLKQRYAKGEISREEYERMNKDLSA